MNRSLETRLRRIEQARMPAAPLRALILQARPDEDVAPRIAQATGADTHRPSWPILIVRAADWPAHHENRVGGIP